MNLRDYTDRYFIRLYKKFNGHMTKTSEVLGISKRTATNWKRRLVDENKMVNITTPGNNALYDNRVQMYDEFCNKKTLKKGSHKFKKYDLYE